VGTIWIGIDDTDSPRGGCTTWVLTELLAEARECRVDLIGEPRLVRLNPNVPWKTRGNAALSARFGVGRGRRRRVGDVGGRPVWSFESERPWDRASRDAWVERAWSCVLQSSRSGEPGTDPALVATDRPLPSLLYWTAVRDIVDPNSVVDRLAALGATVRSTADPRGVVGAAAAVAWPGRRRTWELIAYRSPDRYGVPREVDSSSVLRAQRRHPELFLCHDARTRRLLVAPHTPCPILYGLRATRPEAALAARREVRSETVDRWVLFRTNQGSGDHLLPRSAAELTALRSGVVRGRVSEPATALAGGHVRFEIVDPLGTALTCVAFEPTKTLPRIARALSAGDAVRVWGSRGSGPALRLEGIEVLRAGARSVPPRCPNCRISARSLGRSRGFRCRRCHRRWPPEARGAGSRTLPPPRGVYHPTPSARRHLAPRGPET
jgi:tRNA(Ile2)-agmatinylcytidine synthase